MDTKPRRQTQRQDALRSLKKAINFFDPKEPMSLGRPAMEFLVPILKMIRVRPPYLSDDLLQVHM